MIEDDKIFQAINNAGITAPSDIVDWSSLKKILWILKVAKDNLPASPLSTKTISYLARKLLEENLPEKSVLNTIARAGKTIMKRDNKFYEITRQGREKLEETNLFKKQDILCITGEHPWTDRNKKFLEFLKKLKGEIIILEKHYGLGTFHVLDNLNEGQKVRFLTAELGSNENQDKIDRELVRFKKEFPNIKLKKYPRSWELHDRYIISDNLFVWIGHGIKDFGDKESFLIGIPVEQVSEIVTSLKTKFEERWIKSNNLN